MHGKRRRCLPPSASHFRPARRTLAQGFAYVDFSDEAALTRACQQMDRTEFHGKHILVAPSKPPPKGTAHDPAQRPLGAGGEQRRGGGADTRPGHERAGGGTAAPTLPMRGQQGARSRRSGWVPLHEAMRGSAAVPASRFTLHPARPSPQPAAALLVLRLHRDRV